MKSGHGSLRTNRTVSGSMISTWRTRRFSSLAPAPLYRWKLNFTSSALTGSPLWNLRPRRSLNSYVNPSGLSVHDSAKLLPIFCPGSGRTSASCSAYSIPKGVIWGGAVDGSSQVGLMVTGHAITASPVGVGWPVAPWTPPSVSAPATSSPTMRRGDGVIRDSRVGGPIFMPGLHTVRPPEDSEGGVERCDVDD